MAKRRTRTAVCDLPTGPKAARPSGLSVEQDAVVVAVRRHTLLPPDDGLCALQATIPNLARSSLHRGLLRPGFPRPPEVDGDKPGRRAFKATPIGVFHIDVAEVRTGGGRLHLFVAIDRTSTFAFAALHEAASAAEIAGEAVGAP